MLRAARYIAVLIPAMMWAAPDARASITFEDRVKAQHAIEEVYWRHRLWPTENKAPKPSLDALMPATLISAKVERYLEESAALERRWRRPITREQLQAELDRMVRNSRDPKLLGELFDALGRDADLIGETLARQLLAERLIRNWSVGASIDSFERSLSIEIASVGRGLVLPALPASTCTNDTWSPTHTELPDGRMYPYAVWTGTEMIVWGGVSEYGSLGTGGRYNPATDSWVATSITADTPRGLLQGSVVWTGTEMILWGGYYPSFPSRRNSGVRYNPVTDTWTPTSTGANVPEARAFHTAVWTGSEMIVWGGYTATFGSAQGGRYNPVSDTWTPTSVGAGTPSARQGNTAVWTGSEMIIWGGMEFGPGTLTNTGGRYNPATNAWTATSTGAGDPAARQDHDAIWTGSEMIVWGGGTSSLTVNSGGRYNPATNTWTPTSVGQGVPSPRSDNTTIWTGSKMIVCGGETPDTTSYAYDPASDSWASLASFPYGSRARHAAVWTGNEMLVWGGGQLGFGAQRPYHTGARYDPDTDSWVTMSLGGVPAEREAHSAVWTGTEMIIWGGRTNSDFVSLPPLNTGGRYTPATDSWLPTSTGTNVPAPRKLHAAVWTGREMVVWGGQNLNVSGINSGGRYVPWTDSWLPTSEGANWPTPRRRPIAVWSGQELILFGDATLTGGRYNPSSNTWTPTAVGPAYQGDGQTAVWSGTEMLVYQGGFAPAGRYNPTTNSWGVMSPAPLSNRLNSASVWTGTEMIVWGGNDTNTGARYNPATNVWTPTSTGANVATARAAHSAVWTGNEMLIWGGFNPNAALNPIQGSRYDPGSDSWQPMSLGPNQPTQRTFHSALWTGSTMIVWGGNITTSTGSVYCACPEGRIVYRDADGDGYGDPGVSTPRCDGSMPIGYSTDALDCDDANALIHADAVELCNTVDDDCDGLVDESASGEDSDGDGVRDLCDGCVTRFDPGQSDTDHDGEGDACDVNDGIIFIFGPADDVHVQWQGELGPSSWNVYFGDLAVLRGTGVYTQAPGSNPLAARSCGVAGTTLDDPLVPSPGATRITLVTGVATGIEGSLGTDSAGNPRSNGNPCP